MGQLRVALIDVRGRPLQESALVTLRHRAGGQVLQAMTPPGKAALIPDLREQPDGVYQVTIAPPSYHQASCFVDVLADGVTRLDLVCAVDPAKVRGVTLPAFETLPVETRRLLNVIGRLEELGSVQQAGLLNILAKSSTTRFANGRVVASYFQTLVEIRGDRIFVDVPPSLFDDTTASVAAGLFVPVSGSLHHMADGFVMVGSFKTPDRYGNLQLTFFRRQDAWRVDADVDEAEGLQHLFQATWQEATHTVSDPYNIQQILLQYQKLDPLYDLALA